MSSLGFKLNRRPPGLITWQPVTAYLKFQDIKLITKYESTLHTGSLHCHLIKIKVGFLYRPLNFSSASPRINEEVDSYETAINNSFKLV